VKLLVEFPFPLSRKDKESLAQILARGDKKASDWSKEGADIVYRSRKIQLLVECKSFRQTVAKNLQPFAGAGGVSSPHPKFGGRTRFSWNSNSSTACRVALSKGRKGAPEQEIVEDFPSLSERDLAYARPFSRFGEKPGRPKKQMAIHGKRRATQSCSCSYIARTRMARATTLRQSTTDGHD
jgi:hypothetical protein